MNESPREFRERLLEAERPDPRRKEKYRKELEAMLEMRLTGVRKWAWIGAAVMGRFFVVLFGTVAVLSWGKLPILASLSFVLGAVFGLAWAVFALRILRKGVLHLEKDETFAAGLGWGFTVITMTLFMLVGGQLPDRTTGIQMVLSGLVFLVMAAVFLILARVNRAELNVKEKLLEIEHRLAELAERKEET